MITIFDLDHERDVIKASGGDQSGSFGSTLRLRLRTGRFDKLSGRFDRLSGRFEKLSGRFDKLRGRFDKLSGRFGSLSLSKGTATNSCATIWSGIDSRRLRSLVTFSTMKGTR